jgi:rubrerythrin
MYDGAKRQDIKDLLNRLISEEKSHLGYFKSVLKEIE